MWSRRGSALVAFAALCGLGVTMLFWHASTLRLDPNGSTLVWAALGGFGIGWMMRERSPLHALGGLLAGSTAGVLGALAALRYLPLTPLGRGIGLGVAAAVTVLAVVVSRRRIPLGPTAVAFAMGVAAADLAGLGGTSDLGDAAAVWTALVFAFVLGVLGVEAVAALRARPAQPEDVSTIEPKALPQPRTPEPADDRTEVFGPVLEPPTRERVVS